MTKNFVQKENSASETNHARTNVFRPRFHWWEVCRLEHPHGKLDHLHGHEHGDEPWVRHERLHMRPRNFLEKTKQFLWGFFFFEWYHELQHERAKYNDVMNLILYGELLGIPLMNSSIGLRLLPFVLPELQSWKHRQLEEHELVEHAPHMH